MPRCIVAYNMGIQKPGIRFLGSVDILLIPYSISICKQSHGHSVHCFFDPYSQTHHTDSKNLDSALRRVQILITDLHLLIWSPI